MANEKRMIYADDAKEMLRNHADEFSDVLNRREKALLIGGGTSCIDKCPTVDAVEVVHGKWHKPTPCSQEFCTNCGLTPKTNFGWLPPYCPNCGAKMDGDGNG